MPIVALKGARYRDVQNDALAEWIPLLRAMDFRTAVDFYREIVPTLTRAKDRALLACNDRFYLMFAILGRVDVMHPDPLAPRLTPTHSDQVIDTRARDGRCDGGGLVRAEAEDEREEPRH
jgi:hypothetical protein